MPQPNLKSRGNVNSEPSNGDGSTTSVSEEMAEKDKAVNDDGSRGNGNLDNGNLGNEDPPKGGERNLSNGGKDGDKDEKVNLKKEDKVADIALVATVRMT